MQQSSRKREAKSKKLWQGRFPRKSSAMIAFCFLLSAFSLNSQMQWTFTLDQLPETARQFWEYFGDKQVFTLDGPMGAGKTTLVKALCAAKGVEDATASPTFSIINEYAYHDAQGQPRRIFHLDLYRLKDEDDAISAGVEDTLYQDAISFVEWPEVVAHMLPPDTVHLQLEVQPDQKRVLREIASSLK
jgi:tRNA threonylcarbamoyladenosine biosynthesis protein TsaE